MSISYLSKIAERIIMSLLAIMFSIFPYLLIVAGVNQLVPFKNLPIGIVSSVILEVIIVLLYYKLISYLINYAYRVNSER